MAAHLQPGGGLMTEPVLPPDGTPAPRQFTRRQVYGLLIALGAVLLVSGTALLFGQGWRFWRDGPDDLIAAGKPVTVLLNGLDADRELAGSIVAVYEATTPRLLLLGIPANTRLTAEAGSEMLLSAAYAEGGNGQRQALSAFLKTEVPFHVDITMEEFYRLIDLLRGVEVRLDRALAATVRGEAVTVPLERYRFTSDKAREIIAYAGAAAPGEQQELLQRLAQGFVAQVRLQRALLEHPDAWGLISDWLRGNLTPQEARLLLLQAAACPAENVLWQSLPGSTEIRDGAAVFLPQPLDLATLVPPPAPPAADVVEPPVEEGLAAPPALPRLKVALLNGCGISGIAHGLRDLLGTHADVDVVEVGNADNFAYQRTKVIARTGGLAAAQRVQGYLGFGDASAAPDAQALVDVTIIIGRDYAARAGR